jgi:crotonobetainyl-CoA:carnitine CoA-transferase CaiB-like acyl-CoA transferase
MFDAMISAMSSNYASFLGDPAAVPRPMGTRYPTVVPYGVYAARDRDIAIAAGSEKLWASFRRALELPDDARFETNALRIRNRDALDAILKERFAGRSAGEWIGTLRREGVPCSLVLNFQEVAAHPQSAFRGMFPTLAHPKAGEHRVVGPPVKPAAKPAMAAPLLGQHTFEALGGLLGLRADELNGLRERGVIYQEADER